MPAESLRPYLWMLTGCLSFALMTVLAKWAGNFYEWQVLAIVRSALPLMIVATWAVLAGAQLVFWKPLVLWMRSIAGSISLIGTFFLLHPRHNIPVADITTVAHMYPIWVAILSWPMLGIWPSGQVWISIAIAMVGVVIIQQAHIVQGNFALLFAVAVSLCTSLAMIGLNRLKEIDTRAVVVHFSATSLMFAVAAYFLFEHQPPKEVADGGSVLILVGVGVMATIGQMCLTMAFTTGEPAKMSVVGLSQIVFTIALEAIVLEVVPEGMKLLGIPLVLLPTAWLMYSKRPSKVEVGEEILENT